VGPLWRNRDFVLLQAGELLSAAGTSTTAIAYPLLVLGISHSPAQAGLVAFARLTPFGLFSLVAGLAADRWPRKRLMVAADVVRAAALGGLAVTLLADAPSVWAILVVGFVEGTGATFFNAAQSGAFRSVVPRAQLPAAVGANQTGMSTVRLVGPPLGGALYELHRAAPFLADAVSYVCSTLSLLAMRTPFQEEREHDPAPLRTQLAAGFRFLWGEPFLRATTLIYGLGNPLAPAILLVIVVFGREQGLSGGEIGILTAALGAATLVGALASPLFRSALTARTILLLELWTWLGLWAFVVWPNVYVLTAALTLFGLAAPVTDSVVVGLRLAITPDRLVGRVESVRMSIALLIAPLGPLVAGLLLDSASAQATVAVFAVLGVFLAVCGTLSGSLRSPPSLVAE
jgi:predicted MFS family arabinose efflux permease